MKLTDLSIDHFGALSQYSVGKLSPGLNVIHGPNGSGKTTLMQFLRGMFAGFDEARRLQLIPPVAGGSGGGTVGVDWAAKSLSVVRQSRPDGREPLSINVRNGQPDEALSFRRYLEGLDDRRLAVVYTAGSFDANAVDAVISLARQDGIGLTTTPGNELQQSVRFSQLYARRDQLRLEASGPEVISRLNVQIAQLDREILQLQQQLDEHRGQGSRERSALQAFIGEVDREAERLHADWQSLATDLTECQNRLWNQTTRTVQDVVVVHEPEPTPESRLPEVDEIDQRILHLRQTLKALAASRQQVSVGQADAAGADVPSREVFAQRQRESLRIMQQQLMALSGTVRWMESRSASGACVCQTSAERISTIADELRRQVELSCQELSRHQAAWQLEQYRHDRQSIDDCEAGLHRQVEWLQRRREELLLEAAHPVISRLVHPVPYEREYCGCPDHSATSHITSLRLVPRQTTFERSVVESSARPGDFELERHLSAFARTRWEEWQAVVSRSVVLWKEWQRMLQGPDLLQVEADLGNRQQLARKLRKDLAVAQAAQADLDAVEAGIREVEQATIRDHASPVLSEASRYLEQLTSGRHRAIRIQPGTSRLEVIAENRSVVLAPALSRGTLFQVALALRVALIDEYARRGLEFPLVLDDVLVDSDERRLEAAVKVLTASATRGRQILFLTCQDHLVTLLEDRGASVHGLPGSVRTRRHQAVFTPAVVPAAVRTSVPASKPETSSRIQFAAADVPRSTARSLPPTLPVNLADSQEQTVPQPVTLRRRPGSSPREGLLNVDRLAADIPSIPPEVVDRLAEEGLLTVGQVIAIDIDEDAPLLTRMRIAPLDLLTWRAEARLLCTVPVLEVEDTQLLVAVGIHSAEELASFSPEQLYQRIQRFRGSTPHAWHRWMRDRHTWPHQDEVKAWIRSARDARPLYDVEGDLVPDLIEEEADEPEASAETGSRSVAELQERRKRRRTRNGRFRIGHEVSLRQAVVKPVQTDVREPRFYLHLESPVVDAPSIGPKTTRLLNRVGVHTVQQLLSRDPAELSRRMAERAYPAALIRAWQQQSRLMCDIPWMQGHDAQMLVACGFVDVNAVAAASDQQILDAVVPFTRSRAGQRMLRSAAAPSRDEVVGWVQWARQLRNRVA